MSEVSKEGDNTVRLSERRAFSRSFRGLHDEGMALIEQTAQYLDGEGRRASRLLEGDASTLYSAESMRLTTRLMQLASWLLLQRAANSGELTREQIEVEKYKVRLDTPAASSGTPGWSELPAPFRDLIERSLSVQTRVRQMDDDLYGAPADLAKRRRNPVSDQIALLKTAFGN